MNRPWVKPEEVIEYSQSAKVKSRSVKQLAFDIARAERYVIFHTHNKFDGDKYLASIPDDVKMAVIILAEAYAKQAIIQKDGIMQSESFDDYSYTASSDTDLAEKLGLGLLLDDYVLEKSGKVTMKLRKL